MARRALACLAIMICAGAEAEGLLTLNADAYFPEGPIWYHGKLYYVEYGRNAVTTWDGKKNRVFSAERGCGQSAVAPFGHDEFLTTCYDNGSGGIYFTASGHLGPVIDAKVFYISAARTISRVADDLHNANGLAVSPDGSLSDRRVFVNLDDLFHHAAPIWPDGVKVSSTGELYVGQSPRDLHTALLGQIFVIDKAPWHGKVYALPNK
jgi:gluconolactonase